MNKTLLVLAILFLTFATQAQNKQKITFEDIFEKGTFRAQSVSGLNSMNDGDHYTTLEGRGTKIIKYSYKTGEQVDVIFDITKVPDAPISNFMSYEFSDDETKILLTTDIQRIYRRSYTAQYYVWNSVTEDLTPLSEKGAQQLATFSPDGERIAFVRENNLFIKNLRFGSESQVTSDGEKKQNNQRSPRLGLRRRVWF